VPVLEIENLVSGYSPHKPIVKDITFSVDDGEFVGIVGPNGSGKTTLLRSIVGLVAINSGSIKISEHKLEHLDKRELARRVAFVPQMMEPINGFTVRDLVMLGRTPYFERFSFDSNDDRDAVNWAIAELKIDNLIERQVTELSGGEFQRVAIARALAQEPRLLLLDEPISHLDIRYQVKLCKLLRQLRSHRSIIATFHDLNMAARFCSKLILLKNGELIAAGKPFDVVTPENIWRAYRIKVTIKKNSDKQRSKYVLLP